MTEDHHSETSVGGSMAKHSGGRSGGLLTRLRLILSLLLVISLAWGWMGLVGSAPSSAFAQQSEESGEKKEDGEKDQAEGEQEGDDQQTKESEEKSRNDGDEDDSSSEKKEGDSGKDTKKEDQTSGSDTEALASISELLQAKQLQLIQTSVSIMSLKKGDPRLAEVMAEVEALNQEIQALQKEKARLEGKVKGDPRQEAVRKEAAKGVTRQTPRPVRRPPVPAAAQQPDQAKPISAAQAASQQSTKSEPEPETDGPRINHVNHDAGPDDVVQLKMTDNMLDLQYLLDFVGKEFKFNILYPPNEPAISGKIRLQLYGDIHRRDLIPMLESFMAFYGYGLVREDPFMRVVKRGRVLQDTQMAIDWEAEDLERGPGESITMEIVQIKHAQITTVLQFLGNFTQNNETIKRIPNTNSLIITEYAHRLPIVLEMISLIDKPGPKVQLKPMPVTHLKASDARGKVMELLNNLKKVHLEMEGAPDMEPDPDATAAGAPARPEQPTPRSRVVRRPTSAAPPQRQATAASAQTPMIFVEARSNRLLIIGTEEEYLQVGELLKLLDVPDSLPIRLEVVTPQYVDAAEVVGKIESLMQRLNPGDMEGEPGEPRVVVPQAMPAETAGGTARPTSRPRVAQPRSASRDQTQKPQGAYMQVDERTNRIFVVGSDPQIRQAKELLALLDLPEVVDVDLQIIHVSFLPVDEVRDQLSDLIKALNKEGVNPTDSRRSTTPGGATRSEAQPAGAPRTTVRRPTTSGRSSSGEQTGENGPYLLGDERTNRLFVVGTPEQIAQVRELLGLLDIPSRPKIDLVPLFVQHVLAEELGIQISALMQDLFLDEMAAAGEPASTQSGTSQRTSRTAQSQRTTSRTARGRSQTNRGSAQAIKVSETGPFIHIDERTNRMLVIGTTDHVDQVRRLQTLLDVPPHEYERLVLKVYQPQYVEAEEVRRILEDLEIIQSGQEQTARERAQERELGGQRQQERPRQPIAPGDQEDAPPPTINADGDFEGPMLLPGEEESPVRVAIQESTNKLFVLATDRQHADIEEVMQHVDLESPNLGMIRIYPLENRDPEFVSGALQELTDAAREVELGGDTAERLPGREGAPVIVALADIYAVAVSASDRQHKEIEEIIKQLDRRLSQVLVEATLIQISVDDSLNVGVSLQGQDTGINEGGGTVSGVSPFNIGEITRGTNIVSGSGATVAFFDDNQIYATLEMLQTTGNSKVISRPRILVNDNETGSINSERGEPTTTTTIPPGSDTPIVSFNDYVTAGTNLSITPHIGDIDTKSLQLEIDLAVNNFEGEGTGNIPPPQATNNITTFVTVPDGKVLVLGGLTRVTDSVQVNKVPLLGDIPLLGALFRSTSRTKDRGVLYVFLKASIVGRPGESGEDFKDLENLTEKARQTIRESEIRYKRQSVIPGLKDLDDDGPSSALDELDR